MDDAARGLLTRLLETPSPSGYEQPVQRIVREWCEPLADSVRTDVHGSVIATLNRGGSPRLLIDAHCDQIGLIVQYVDEKGYLYANPIGGWDTQILLGQAVVVWAHHRPIPGVIARKATHLMVGDEQKKVPDIADLWIDIGAKSRDDVLEHVAIGDPVTVALGAKPLMQNCLAGPKMDNATGLFVLLETLRRLHTAEIQAEVHFVSAVQEEIGLRGATTAAFAIEPDAAIAIDVTHATDCPTINQRSNGDIRMGQGPVLFRGPNVNPVIHSRLEKAAFEHGLSVQPKAIHRGFSNDGNVLQLSRGGVAVGVLGLPLRYMHSPVEVVSLDDLDTSVALLAAFVQGLESTTEFIPR